MRRFFCPQPVFTQEMLHHQTIIAVKGNEAVELKGIKVSFSYPELTDKPRDFGVLPISVENKTGSAVELVWDNCTIILDGQSQGVIHEGVRMINTGSAMTNTTVPPNSTIKDFIVPVNNWRYDEKAQDNVIDGFFGNSPKKGDHELRASLCFIVEGEKVFLDAPFDVKIFANKDKKTVLGE
jgi:hypothetical protein